MSLPLLVELPPSLSALAERAEQSLQAALAERDRITFWEALTRAAEAPGLATNSERVAHRDQVVELLERAFADYGVEVLREARIEQVELDDTPSLPPP